MKVRSAIKMAAVILIIGLLASIAICGLPISRVVGFYDVKPLGSAISLGLDLRGGVYAVYQAKDASDPDLDTKMDGAREILASRLTGQGYTEATVTRQGSDRIRVEIPDVDDPEEILNLIGTPAKLEFYLDGEDTPLMEGADIKSAQAAYTEGNQPVVAFTLNSEGAEAFAKATSENIGKKITIKLDGETISEPTIQTAITGGEGSITNMESIEAAQNLAMLITSGALPIDMEQLEVRTISATLGEDALSTGLKAGIIGVILVMLYMLLVYRLPGLMADIALSGYILIVFLALAIVPGVQLTLPGVAGIILGIGMAVDANVLIFERLKEEVRAGKTLRAALHASFSKAFVVILDSNITTLIAGIVLLFFGTGSIKGFAITLIIGILASMFTALVVSRYLLKLLINICGNNSKLFVSRKNLKPAALETKGGEA